MSFGQAVSFNVWKNCDIISSSDRHKMPQYCEVVFQLRETLGGNQFAVLIQSGLLQPVLGVKDETRIRNVKEIRPLRLEDVVASALAQTRPQQQRPLDEVSHCEVAPGLGPGAASSCQTMRILFSRPWPSQRVDRDRWEKSPKCCARLNATPLHRCTRKRPQVLLLQPPPPCRMLICLPRTMLWPTAPQLCSLLRQGDQLFSFLCQNASLLCPLEHSLLPGHRTYRFLWQRALATSHTRQVHSLRPGHRT